MSDELRALFTAVFRLGRDRCSFKFHHDVVFPIQSTISCEHVVRIKRYVEFVTTTAWVWLGVCWWLERELDDAIVLRSVERRRVF